MMMICDDMMMIFDDMMMICDDMMMTRTWRTWAAPGGRTPPGPSCTAPPPGWWRTGWRGSRACCTGGSSPGPCSGVQYECTLYSMIVHCTVWVYTAVVSWWQSEYHYWNEYYYWMKYYFWMKYWWSHLVWNVISFLCFPSVTRWTLNLGWTFLSCFHILENQLIQNSYIAYKGRPLQCYL